jgi:glutathione synthase
MDPVQTIIPYKDSTLALLLEAQSRGWVVRYMEFGDLRLRDGKALARMRELRVDDDNERWFELGKQEDTPLSDLDVILMRKDPPFDMEYIATTYILERAEAEGVMVTNRPCALRDVNEKAYTAWFPQCCPASLLTRSKSDLRAFLHEHGRIVLKPLDAMGGRSVFLLTEGDLNTNVILETITDHERKFTLAQSYIPDIAETGDKRIILVDGEPVPYALARIPPEGDARANLAVGGKPEGRQLTRRDTWICKQVGPVLREKGLLFVGLDVIGDYLTEINVTSPTGIRELDRTYGINIASQLFDAIEKGLGQYTQKSPYSAPAQLEEGTKQDKTSS